LECYEYLRDFPISTLLYHESRGDSTLLQNNISHPQETVIIIGTAVSTLDCTRLNKQILIKFSKSIFFLMEMELFTTRGSLFIYFLTSLHFLFLCIYFHLTNIIVFVTRVVYWYIYIYITPCSPLKFNWNFERTRILHLQGKIGLGIKQSTHLQLVLRSRKLGSIVYFSTPLNGLVIH
jgi:hypothetical protein